MCTARASEIDSRALSFISLDNDIPDNAMSALKALGTLTNVARIQLN
jgi:hypothetical protein